MPILKRRTRGDNSEFKYTLFHVIAAALVKTVVLRPKMNRFIQGKRMYQRKGISLAFVAKKYFGDDAKESLLVMEFDEHTTVNSVHDEIFKVVHKVRSEGKTDASTQNISAFLKMPRALLTFVMFVMRRLDYYGVMPKSLVAEDPNYSSVFISNLGSIRLHAQYHHLNNWGTNSMFVVIGEKYRAPVFADNGTFALHDMLDISVTLDERIADGYYYSKSFKLLKHLLQNPQLLDGPAFEEVDYE